MKIGHVHPASVLATAIAMVACGCSASGTTANLADVGQPASITIAAVPSADLSGIYIALDQGLFTREGLNVKLESVASSKAIISAQLKGKIDLCAGAYLPYIADEATGGDDPRDHVGAEVLEDVFAAGEQLRGAHGVG